MSLMSNESKFAEARGYFLAGNYSKAIEIYNNIKSEYPALKFLADFNIILAEKKIGTRVFDSKKIINTAHEQPRVIIYTCNFGNYESIKEPECVDPRIEYIVFTDNVNLKTKKWKTRIINDDFGNARRNSRLAKILPHKYLPDHDISIYLDSSLELVAVDIYKMIDECIGVNDIALYPHFERDCVYDEIDYVMNSSDRYVADKAQCISAIRKYENICYPRNNGLFENAFIIRRNTEKVQNLCEFWWDEYISGTERDQFTLMYVLHKTGVNPVPIKVGSNFRDNPYTKFHQHKYVPSDSSVSLNEERLAMMLSVGDCKEEKTVTVNWIVGGQDNSGWAYENNAKRFIEEQPEFNHHVQSLEYSDVAVYFDVLLFQRMQVPSSQKIVRIGGPRPLNRIAGDDVEKLRVILSNFHHVICLNEDLKNKLVRYHPNIHVIPNGIDLQRFHPRVLDGSNKRTFTVGFAASVKSTEERHVKGLDLVISACLNANVNLLNVGRGKSQTQIPHELMIEEFYSNIDVLVHPVESGREGSSNVIMEALALGIPVITTTHAGYHAEKLTDGTNFLLCKRDAVDIAKKITLLRNDNELRKRISEAGRNFAEKNHNIRIISKKYEEIIIDCKRYAEAKMKVCFVPFWYPVTDFATGRLRCIYTAKLLKNNSNYYSRVGYDSSADIVIISQLASDAQMAELKFNKNQFVIYDLCDRYFCDDRIVGGVNAKSRFFEIADRADLIVTSTIELKRSLYELGLEKPIIHIPDGIDFKESTKLAVRDARHLSNFNVGWFGNPGRGNLDSAIWLLHRAQKTGHKVTLITRKKSVQSYAEFYDSTIDWQYDTFISELEKFDVAVVTHSQEEQSKSPNRLLTAVRCRVPVIVSSSQSCEKILKAVGLSWAVVNNEQQLDHALKMLSTPEIRSMYFDLIEPYIEKFYGDELIKNTYIECFNSFVIKERLTAKKILFVSHNLSMGEGAPTSLFQLVLGLKKFHNIMPHVFCPMTGDFYQLYIENGIPVHCYTNIVSKDSLKPMNANYERAKLDFQNFVESEKFDLVVCNTAKMLPYADFSEELSIPAVIIIRESSDEHINLTFSKNDKITKASINGLKSVRHTIFVSDVTRQAWRAKQHLPITSVIHNGIITNQWGSLNVVSKEELRDKLNLPKDKIILLSVGTINKRKAQIDIINAFQMLPEHIIKKTCLVLVGARESAYLSALKIEVESLPPYIRNSIVYVPETDSVGEWYKSADIFVFSSHNESYPRVIVEALYFGLSIVSSRVYGVIEQLGRNEDASIYEVGDVAALSNALKSKILGFSRVKKSNDNFYTLTTYHEMLGKYAALLSGVLAGKKEYV